MRFRYLLTLAISDLIVDRDLDVLCVTETWLRADGDDVPIGEMTPPGYSLLHCPRLTGRGGGVAILYRQHLKVRQCKLRSFTTFDNIEVCLAVGKRTVRLSVLYRPPPSQKNRLTVVDFLAEFTDFLSDDSLPAENTILVGDLNFHMDKPDDTDTRRFIQLFSPLGFCQLVTEPTHVKNHTLDVVLTRCTALVSRIDVENLCMSDHFLVTVHTDFSRPRLPRKTIRCRNLKKIDRDHFRDDLKISSLFDENCDDVDALVECYNKTMVNLLDKHAPEREKTVPDRPASPWITDDVLKARQFRRRSERKMRKTGLVVDREAYKRARRSVTKSIENAKTNHFQTKLQEASSDPRKMFAVLNSVLNRGDRSGVLPDVESQQAASLFSEFFQDKIAKIMQRFAGETVTEIPNQPDCTLSLLSLFHTVSEEQILKLIAKSTPTTAAIDPAPTSFVLEFTDVLITVFHKIINLSLQSGIVPTAFKKAIVKPLIKKSGLDPETLSNYRPVSNLPFLSKILEKAVAEQLVAHLDANNLQVKFQSAYRCAHSTETALLRVLNDLLSIVDSGDSALLVLHDLSAAFDTIDHSLLLQRLCVDVGLDDKVLAWFSSYLSGRIQQVLVGRAFSPESPLLYGVPQGSVLGPLLFSLYTSQLAALIQNFNIGYHFFADDSELYSRIPTDHSSALEAVRNMESCCDEIKLWMDRNKLKLNEDKTEVLLCGPVQRRERVPFASVQVGDACITFSDSVKTLGVVLDADLSMHEQISSVVRVCYFHIRSLSKARPYLTRQAANQIAVSLIISKLDYCNSLLAGLPQTEITRLQAVQNAAARVVVKARKYDHISPILKDLHWLPIEDRIQHKILSTTYRAVNDKVPQYLSELVPLYTPTRSLRSATKLLLDVPGPKDAKLKRYGQRAFKYVAPTLWNNLPGSIREKDSLQAFKSALKTHLFRQ